MGATEAWDADARLRMAPIPEQFIAWPVRQWTATPHMEEKAALLPELALFNPVFVILVSTAALVD